MLILSLLLLSAAAFQSAPPAPPTPPPTQTPAPALPIQEDPQVTALALKVYSQIRTGKVDEALLTPRMAAAFTPAALAHLQPIFDQLGDPTRLTVEKRDQKDDTTQTPPVHYLSYSYLAVFPTAQLHITITLSPEGKVAGYLVRP